MVHESCVTPFEHFLRGKGHDPNLHNTPFTGKLIRVLYTKLARIECTAIQYCSTYGRRSSISKVSGDDAYDFCMEKLFRYRGTLKEKCLNISLDL